MKISLKPDHEEILNYLSSSSYQYLTTNLGIEKINIMQLIQKESVLHLLKYQYILKTNQLFLKNMIVVVDIIFYVF